MKEQGYEQLTLFLEDSPASRLALPGSEEARKMTVTSGRKCYALYRKSGPLGLLVRMLLESSIWRSTRCWLTWKASATPAKRLLFRLVPSMPRTEGTDARLWPTVRAEESGAYQYSQGKHDKLTLTLTGAARLWPTPTARDCKGANSTEHLATSNHVGQLANYVKLIPTVTTGAGMCGGSENYKRLKEMEDAGVITTEERRSMAAGNGGQLNPTWVEWLMGFPAGWTDLEGSETP